MTGNCSEAEEQPFIDVGIGLTPLFTFRFWTGVFVIISPNCEHGKMACRQTEIDRKLFVMFSGYGLSVKKILRKQYALHPIWCKHVVSSSLLLC